MILTGGNRMDFWEFTGNLPCNLPRSMLTGRRCLGGVPVSVGEGDKPEKSVVTLVSTQAFGVPTN